MPLDASGSATSASGLHRQGQISPDKNGIPRRTTAALTSLGPWLQELRSHLPARPGRRRLRCGSCTAARGLRSSPPPHVRSPSRSCDSLASLRPARPGTCTPKIAPMLGVPRKGPPCGGPFVCSAAKAQQEITSTRQRQEPKQPRTRQRQEPKQLRTPPEQAPEPERGRQRVQEPEQAPALPSCRKRPEQQQQPGKPTGATCSCVYPRGVVGRVSVRERYGSARDGCRTPGAQNPRTRA